MELIFAVIKSHVEQQSWSCAFPHHWDGGGPSQWFIAPEELRGAQIQVYSANCMLISWYPFLEGKCDVEQILLVLPLMTAG